MESKLYACLKYGKDGKFTNRLIRHVNTYKIPNSLLYCQSSNLELVLDYNKTNLLDLLSDNHKEDINLRRSNNGKQRIRLADMDNDEENIRPAVDIDKQRPAISN